MPHLETRVERLEYLRRLREAAHAIARERHCYCVDAQYRLSYKGDESFAVQIEEASPDDGELQKFINERLAEVGFGGVQVETEW